MSLNKIKDISRVAAIGSAVCAFALTSVFHHSRGVPVALLLGFAFGSLGALVAYGLTHFYTRGRVGKKKPVLGAVRGAMLGIVTFVITVTIHTAFYPGQGGFFISLLPILAIGCCMFGWVPALVGACIGVYGDRRCFA